MKITLYHQAYDLMGSVRNPQLGGALTLAFPVGVTEIPLEISLGGTKTVKYLRLVPNGAPGDFDVALELVDPPTKTLPKPQLPEGTSIFSPMNRVSGEGHSVFGPNATQEALPPVIPSPAMAATAEILDVPRKPGVQLVRDGLPKEAPVELPARDMTQRERTNEERLAALEASLSVTAQKEKPQPKRKSKAAASK